MKFSKIRCYIAESGDSNATISKYSFSESGDEKYVMIVDYKTTRVMSLVDDGTEIVKRTTQMSTIDFDLKKFIGIIANLYCSEHSQIDFVKAFDTAIFLLFT